MMNVTPAVTARRRDTWQSEVGDRRDHLPADDLQRLDPIHVRDEADHGLDPQVGEPSQPTDHLADFLTFLAHVEGERAGLLDLLVMPALILAMPAQDVQLPRNLRTRTQAAGVAGDQAQGLFLAVACDHDRWVGPAQALWNVERSLEPVVLSLEGAPVVAPHPQGYLHRLLEHLEALFERREGDPEPPRLLFVMAGPDAECGATAGVHVQRTHRLGQYSRMPEVHSRHYGREIDPAGVGGQECQGRVALQLLGLRPAHDRVLPEMVRHADAIEAAVLSVTRDLGQRGAGASRPAGPAEVVDLQSNLHEPIPPFPSPDFLISEPHSVVMRRLVWMSMCRALPVPELTNLCGAPGGATTICPPVASTVVSPTVKVSSPSCTTKTSS